MRQVGPVNYLVKNADSQIVKRHLDQLRPAVSQTGDETEPSVKVSNDIMTPSMHDYQSDSLPVSPVKQPEPVPVVPTCSVQAFNVNGAEGRLSTNVNKDASMSVNKNVNNSMPLRRSSRIVKRPVRLDL